MQMETILWWVGVAIVFGISNAVSFARGADRGYDEGYEEGVMVKVIELHNGRYQVEHQEEKD